MDQVDGRGGARALAGQIVSVWLLLAVLHWLLVHLGAVPASPWTSWSVLAPFVVTGLGAVVGSTAVLRRVLPGGPARHPIAALAVVAASAVVQTAVTGYPFLYPRLVAAAGVTTLHHVPGPRGVRAYVAVVLGGVVLCLVAAHPGPVPHVLPAAVDVALGVGIATTAAHVATTMGRAAAAVERARQDLLAAEQRRVRELRHAADHDPLTGVLNRSGLQRAVRALATNGPSSATAGVGVVYVDLDGFKAVNDRHGHGAGDEVLVTAASRLRALARDGDVVARVGGDEFVLVLTACDDEAQVDLVGSRVREHLQRPVVVVSSAGRGPVTVTTGASCGTAWGPAGRTEPDVDALVAAADAEMFLAKAAHAPRPARR